MAAGERPAFEPLDDWRIEFEPRGRKREGSQAFQRYEKYKKAKTIGDFYALGGRKVDLQNDFTKELCEITSPDGSIHSKNKIVKPDGTVQYFKKVTDEKAKAKPTCPPAEPTCSPHQSPPLADEPTCPSDSLLPSQRPVAHGPQQPPADGPQQPPADERVLTSENLLAEIGALTEEASQVRLVVDFVHHFLIRRVASHRGKLKDLRQQVSEISEQASEFGEQPGDPVE
jgi:hypothetical protein